jgi:hypothetical protein
MVGVYGAYGAVNSGVRKRIYKGVEKHFVTRILTDFYIYFANYLKWHSSIINIPYGYILRVADLIRVYVTKTATNEWFER